MVIAGAIAAIAAWFLYFAHGGLQAGLSGDDLSNLCGYLQKPGRDLVFDTLRFWSTAYRPLGALFYVPLYKAFGLNPLPYRIVCFAILGLNLALLYRFCARLTNSREIAFLAAFLASYHAWFVDLYYIAGTIYDLLCYSLYLGALLVYAGIRARGRTPGPRARWPESDFFTCLLSTPGRWLSLFHSFSFCMKSFFMPRRCATGARGSRGIPSPFG